MPADRPVFAEIALWRNNLLDWEIVVDDYRDALCSHVGTYVADDETTDETDFYREAARLDALLAEAIEHRNHAARRLAALIASVTRTA